MPNNSTPYNKMAYASAKGRFRETLPGVFDIQAASLEELQSSIISGGAAASAEDEDDDDFDF
jgi:hypothetical protein